MFFLKYKPSNIGSIDFENIFVAYNRDIDALIQDLKIDLENYNRRIGNKRYNIINESRLVT